MTSISDPNILNIICNFINDANTFFNFALACKKTSAIAQSYMDKKMSEFAVRIVEHDEDDGDGDQFTYVYYKLPNGNLHGQYSSYCSYVHTGDDYAMYYNGILLARWWDDYGEGIDIKHYKCDCTKKFENTYTTDKICSENYELESKKIKKNDETTICKKCNTELIIVEEEWVNKSERRTSVHMVTTVEEFIPIDDVI